MTLETDFLELINSHVRSLTTFDDEMEASNKTPAQGIPLYQHQGPRLLCLQKKNRDTPAKCSAPEMVQISTCKQVYWGHANHQLMADEISQYKRKVCLTRANQLTREYSYSC